MKEAICVQLLPEIIKGKTIKGSAQLPFIPNIRYKFTFKYLAIFTFSLIIANYMFRISIIANINPGNLFSDDVEIVEYTAKTVL